MGDAYTPGLTVSPLATVRKTRRLPLSGEVVVERGARVKATDVVARTELPGKVHLINFANKLGVHADELPDKMLVKEGEKIKRGQRLAESKSFFGLFSSEVDSPIDGTLESVSIITGQGVLREPPQPVEVTAYVDGEIVEIIDGEGVVVETRGALVQGIFGLGGEIHAPLAVVGELGGRLDSSSFNESHKGKIVVGGADIDLDGIHKAIERGVAGIVVGGFAYHDIRELLGYDIGVAVTGTEQIGTTLIVTEGFGHIKMAAATFELLAAHDGEPASLTGATQIRAGVIRPEVVIPASEAKVSAKTNGAPHGLAVGAPVRCIRAPYFGEIGTVSDLPVDLQIMPSETKVRVVEVALAGGDTIVLPRANVEVIEG